MRGIDASFGQRRAGFSEAIVFTVGGGSMDECECSPFYLKLFLVTLLRCICVCVSLANDVLGIDGNLQEWAKRTTTGGAAGTGKKRVVYGSTALYSPTTFVTEDLAQLGKEST